MKRKKRDVSNSVIKRLPRYYRFLDEMMKKGQERTSSHEMSQIMGITASQIRQDLNNFGGFGQQGYGYNVKALFYEMDEILGLNKDYNMIIIGAGNIGQAIASYANFERKGINITALFDINPRIVGITIRGVPVLDIDKLEEHIKVFKTDIAVLALPPEGISAITERLAKTEIKGVWNFCPMDLRLPERIKVENVHLSESLYTLIYKVNN